jgi:hypothetical protein
VGLVGRSGTSWAAGGRPSRRRSRSRIRNRIRRAWQRERHKRKRRAWLGFVAAPYHGRRLEVVVGGLSPWASACEAPRGCPRWKQPAGAHVRAGGHLSRRRSRRRTHKQSLPRMPAGGACDDRSRMTAGRSATMSVASTGSGSRRLERAFVDGGFGLMLARQCGVARARRSRRHAGRSRCVRGRAHVVVEMHREPTTRQHAPLPWALPWCASMGCCWMLVPVLAPWIATWQGPGRDGRPWSWRTGARLPHYKAARGSAGQLRDGSCRQCC